ncbi:ubiquinol-cytochrome c reductase cytochrome b subunit [Kineosporia sp. J2-2]|uniref:Cytochrome bc1 complex cytochrome b subunit n=1 Tax=Kineosporia corallincola TaxID=2835133 RepID=A0ABS5TIU4_9ACTN|nr:ubiquinol-cytochrome c reductase cytochrome b subunit [Kineosporia corallincola]MBT0771019.1 ubiquinol-cytochrome c reductase cytochrome b subunit [Kineosporia corallincola]
MSTTSPITKAGSTTGNWLDERLGASKVVNGFSRKIFPDHWSFMLGEVALYSFVILLLSGTFLTFFFVPSASEVVYDGPYTTLAGQHVSEAFDSTMHISFEVRGGLLMRQIHHWAALIFVVSIIVHMFRIFFTGAFRKPREMNWVIGMILAILAIAEGFLGYSMPDDLLSGNGLRIAQGIILGIPVVGSYISYFLFGGGFPGDAFIARFYVLHVLLIPAIMLALITFHLILVVVHKHTQYPGPGRTNSNVVGFPLFPIYTAKAGGFFFIVFGVTSLMAALFTINAIWIYGPYDPSPIGAGAQPDFYMGFLDGAVRITPGFLEFEAFGFTISPNIFLPTLVLPGLMVTPALLYPWIEAWVTGDKREHHLLDRPRNVPTRTGLGVMAITLYVLLWISGGNDVIATHLHLSINDITYFLRGAVFILPPLAYVITKRICLGLQRNDREKVLHGRETGRVFRTEEGEVFELHAPLSASDRWLLVGFESPVAGSALPASDAAGVRRPGGKLEGLRQKISKFYFEDRVAPVTPAELEAAHHHGEHEEISASGGAKPIESGH